VRAVNRFCVTYEAPNYALQRAGTHKVLDRGRVDAVLERVRCARVLTGWRAVAELGS
jgi:hypothetical protein